MMSSHSETRIRGLDGLRAVAIFMIFALHAWGHSGEPSITIASTQFGIIELTPAIELGGQIGVAIFFIISGFLLSLSFWKHILTRQDKYPLQWKDYFKRRFLRIYPSYILAVIIYALVHDTNHSFNVRAIHIISHVLLIHNLFEVTIYNISTPLWFVATLVQLYLVLPFIFLFISYLYQKDLTIPLILLILFVIAGLIGIVFFEAATYLLSNINLDPRIISINGRVLPQSPFSNLASFSTGVICSYLYVRHSGRKAASHLRSITFEGITIVLVLALLIIALTSNRFAGFAPSLWPGLQLILGGLLLALTLSHHRFGIIQLLELYPIRYLGIISFSFYLYHDLILWNVFNRLRPFLGETVLNANLPKCLIAFLLTIGVAWGFYTLVEGRLTTYFMKRPIQWHLKTST
ncbi:MAG: acyltransferase [Anaerolineae bacterium]|nr:acyltransferase [Anaerolineae bacterium]